MQFVSTRDTNQKVSFAEAILKPVPKDGGMYVPANEDNLRPWILHLDASSSFSSIAGSLTSALLKDEFSPLISENIAQTAFPFSPELKQLDKNLFVLELFHGPTGSHKDFGVSYLASCLEHILHMEDKKATVLAVTNGETGACIANAFRGKKHLRAVLLYAKGTARGFRETDVLSQGGNIIPVEVNGSEEDCFQLVRDIYADQDLIEKYNLSLANSLNIGRLLPHSFFYTYAFSRLKKIVHSDIFYAMTPGNYGNLVAGLYSWKFSLPVNGFIATSTPELYDDIQGKCAVSNSHIPLEKRNVSDPVNPSNIERLEEIFAHNPQVIRAMVYPAKISESETEVAFKELYKNYKALLDPSTAGAYAAVKKRQDIIYADDGVAVLLSRYHPSFFADQARIWGAEKVKMPEQLVEMQKKQRAEHCIEANKQALEQILKEST
ncbi:MAG TPA: pyridoxal-phosphate dependent enzyme [Treponemataceae bacterium]|nr:pyridoxal-phosphate dependent enzyme [Treponemataceae bacterium]